jgi:hypothetical protein
MTHKCEKNETVALDVFFLSFFLFFSRGVNFYSSECFACAPRFFLCESDAHCVRERAVGGMFI